MIRKDKLMASRTSYAFDLTSFHGELGRSLDGSAFYRGHVNAAWFRRRRNVTIACIGTLSGSIYDFDTAPADAAQFLAQFNDGRWGGDCHGRWDGAKYWGSQDPEEIQRHLALLRPMLNDYPNLPAGYDGWYIF